MCSNITNDLTILACKHFSLMAEVLELSSDQIQQAGEAVLRRIQSKNEIKLIFKKCFCDVLIEVELFNDISHSIIKEFSSLNDIKEDAILFYMFIRHTIKSLNTGTLKKEQMTILLEIITFFEGFDSKDANSDQKSALFDDFDNYFLEVVSGKKLEEVIGNIIKEENRFASIDQIVTNSSITNNKIIKFMSDIIPFTFNSEQLGQFELKKENIEKINFKILNILITNKILSLPSSVINIFLVEDLLKRSEYLIFMINFLNSSSKITKEDKSTLKEWIISSIGLSAHDTNEKRSLGVLFLKGLLGRMD